jgi:hypothetical protein
MKDVFTRRSGRGGEGRNLIASYSSSQSQQKVRGGRGEGITGFWPSLYKTVSERITRSPLPSPLLPVSGLLRICVISSHSLSHVCIFVYFAAER